MNEFLSDNIPFVVSLGMSVSMPVISAVYSIKLIKNELNHITAAHYECKKERKEHESRFESLISSMRDDLSYLNGRMNGKKP